MADKDIIIGLKTIGADAAAAEIIKVDVAQDGLQKTGGKATQELDKFARGGQRVTAANVNMRGAIQNTAFQVQDMAVQLEMGTSAVRVFSQQVPQLLGGFGAVGAIAGAVIGIGVPLAAALFQSGKEAEDSAPKIDALNQILDDHAEAAQMAADAKRSEDVAAWLDALDSEEQYYAKINTQIERQIALQAKLRAAKEGADSSEREAKIADIEGDITLNPLDKINQVADIREEDALAKAEAKKAALQDQAARDAAASNAAQEKAQRQADDAAAATKKRQETEAKAAELDAKSKAGAEAGKSLPKLEGELASAKRNAAMYINPETGAVLPGAEKFQQESERLKAEIAAAKKAAADAPKAAEELKGVNTDLAGLKAGETTEKKEADDARTEAEVAFGKSQDSAAELRGNLPQIEREYEAGRQVRERRKNTALNAADAQMRAERQAAAQKAERERLNDGLQDREGRLDNMTAGNAARVGASNRPELAGIAKDIGNADTAKEIADLSAKVKASGAQLGGATVAALQTMLENQSRLVGEIATIQAQIKNLRPVGK